MICRYLFSNGTVCAFEQIFAHVVDNLKQEQRDIYAPVAQLDRASGYEPAGRPFESGQAH